MRLLQDHLKSLSRIGLLSASYMGVFIIKIYRITLVHFPEYMLHFNMKFTQKCERNALNLKVVKYMHLYA